eukprot:4709515-Alexandrium_andersonii.AAC.1
MGLDGDVAVAHVVRVRCVLGRLGAGLRRPLAPVEAQDVADHDGVRQARVGRGVVGDGRADVASK